MPDIQRCDITRATLTGEGAAGPDVESRREVVRAAGIRSRVSFASSGHLRAVDVWSDGSSLVMHPATPSADLPREATLVTGEEACLAWVELLAHTDGGASTATPNATPPVAVDGTAAEIVERVVTGPSGTRAVAVTTRSADSEASHLVRLESGGRLVWGSALGDGPVVWTDGRQASYWAEALARLH